MESLDSKLPTREEVSNCSHFNSCDFNHSYRIDNRYYLYRRNGIDKVTWLWLLISAVGWT